jgi:hypothetical protein
MSGKVGFSHWLGSSAGRWFRRAERLQGVVCGHSHQIFARAKWLFLRRGQQQRENSENYDQQSNRRKFAMILRTAT